MALFKKKKKNDENRMNIYFNEIKDNSKLIINIDHHKNNSNFGQINLVDSKSSATSEIIYELVEKYYRKFLDYNIALGIYVGILTDTGKFQYSNTSQAVHRIVSELLKFSISPSKVHKYIYENAENGDTVIDATALTSAQDMSSALVPGAGHSPIANVAIADQNKAIYDLASDVSSERQTYVLAFKTNGDPAADGTIVARLRLVRREYA